MKTFGYLLSTVGLFFLAFVAFANATMDWHYWLLVAGVVLSVLGTLARWLYFIKNKDINEF